MSPTKRFDLRPPTRVQRLWFWWLRLPAPISVSSSGSADWVRLLPQSWTRTHRNYAAKHGYYWLPCILCGRPYGGHQHAGSIPDPMHGPGSGRSVGICPHCTRAGCSVELDEEDLLGV